MIRFELLGPVNVRADGDPVPLGPPLRRTLLALLVWHRGATVSVDRIIDALWEDDPPSRPESSIQAMMSHLRRAVEPDRGPRTQAEILRTQLPGYRLVLPTDGELDVDLFHTELDAARRAAASDDHVLAGQRATAALQLWSGTPFAGVLDVSFVREAVDRLESERTAAQLIRCAAAVETGSHAEVLGELETLARAQPFDEAVARLLVLALHRSGRTADALSRHRAFVVTLADDLGLDPSPAFADLQERVLRQDPELLGRPVIRSGPSAPSAPVAPPSLAAVAAPSIFGRPAELRVIEDVVAAAAAGRPGVVLFGGPAGIGKSTLAGELGRQAGVAGVAVGIGRCHEDADVTALWPVQSALAELGAPNADDAASAVAALRERAGLQPVLLIIEDVHWAGAETLRLIGFLAVELASAPVTLVLTSRPEQSPGLVGLLATLTRQSGFQRLDLDELTASDARAVAERAGQGLSPADLDLVVERAGGNPFFVAETARLMAAGDRDGLPGGVRAVVQRRLQSLPESARTVLLASAVLGQRFDLTVLASVLGPEPGPDVEISADLLDALQLAVDLAMLTEPERGDGLAFSHAVVREAVLDAAGTLTRRRWHQRAARALGATGARADQMALAHHLIEGLPLTDRSTAIAAAVAAGEANVDTRTHDTAAYWFGRALDNLPADDQDQRLDLLVRRARALSLASALSELRICVVEAFDLATALGRMDAYAALTEILDLSGGIWYWVDFGTNPAELLQRLQAATAAVEATDDQSPGTLAVLARLRGTEAVGGFYVDTERSRDLGIEAVALAERSGDPEALAAALGQYVRVLWGADRQDEQLLVVDRLIELLRTPPPGADPDGWALYGLIALGARAAALSMHGRVDEAAADVRQALELARRHRLTGAVCQLLWCEVGIAVGRGDLAGAAELSARAIVQQERTQLFQQENLSLVSASEIDRRRGRLGAWGPVIAQIPDAPGLPTGWLSVESAIQRGDLAEARRLAGSVIDAVSAPHWSGWLGTLCMEARALADLGSAERCAEVAAALRPYSGRHALWGSMLWLGPVDFYLGRLAIVAGDLPQARRLLRAALEQARSAGLVPAAADAAEWLSKILPVGADSAAERRDLLTAANAWQQELALVE